MLDEPQRLLSNSQCTRSTATKNYNNSFVMLLIVVSTWYQILSRFIISHCSFREVTIYIKVTYLPGSQAYEIRSSYSILPSVNNTFDLLLGILQLQQPSSRQFTASSLYRRCQVLHLQRVLQLLHPSFPSFAPPASHCCTTNLAA